MAAAEARAFVRKRQQVETCMGSRLVPCTHAAPVRGAGMTLSVIVMPADREAGEPVPRVTSSTLASTALGTGYFAAPRNKSEGGREIPA